jgi:hypothetical protein
MPNVIVELDGRSFCCRRPNPEMHLAAGLQLGTDR